MKSLVAFSLPLLALSAPLKRDASSAPPSFRINKVVSGGSGCPQGSIDVNWTNNGILPIYFGKDFTASVGPSVTADHSRKNCQINLDISYSPGYSYSVYSADYTGYANIESGVKGTVAAHYYFSGEQATGSTSLTLQGPYSGKYVKQDDVVTGVWSPCGQQSFLNVNAEVALTPLGGHASGQLAVNKETGRFANQLYIQWRQC
ncbi:hypothetical protein P171DRAFT_516486 [Karstenula rhodostoma CBS 690.94]|uniref:DUF4360 domain containing protein n=1 Tax=Karstenula rhodostoma CBS 690.94 TaxID=1392251 RepID=A0A9P4UHH8_9PLEO|nr:hypothetical protein P171DRAFT_516486 [Karstenula rhodostoma CBS 690.94]